MVTSKSFLKVHRCLGLEPHNPSVYEIHLTSACSPTIKRLRLSMAADARR